jgi:Fe-S cluster assembly scaffold protein SufB
MILRSALLLLTLAASEAFLMPQRTRHTPSLRVSIGLGPEQDQENAKEQELVYEIPNHEEYRTSRRSKLDEQCDQWFAALLSGEDSPCLGVLAEQARAKLETPVPLVNDIEKDTSDEEWTPYVSTRLPWTPLVPAFGLEQFGLPIPRRNAETWRHFDVPGMVQQEYSGTAQPVSREDFQQQIERAGVWLEDDACEARLVYVNGYFAPELSKTTSDVYNLEELPKDEHLQKCLGRFTDGFTDELAAAVPNGERTETLYSKLSLPDHNLGDPTSQFAINTQQGTACFAALNTIKTRGVAVVRSKSVVEKPVLIIQAVTPSAGGSQENGSGVALHPRVLAVAEDHSRLSLVQSCLDLNDDSTPKPKLYNGYTQIFVGAGANVTHSYLEESGGMVTAGVEKGDEEFGEGEPKAREIEAARPPLKDTHLEAIDVHVTGQEGRYEGTLLSVGGSGRIRVAHSLSLLQPETTGIINGFSLSGGTQRTDMKTNIHHIAAGAKSEQLQKNMIGGRAVGAFRGRIRVEQSAQQTDSAQLSRTVLLSDKARAWAVPSLEIIADDVQCAHGATISDLSEEELFYLRSRGLDRALSRNLLMYAFAGDICSCVDPALLGSVDSKEGLQKRMIRKLENLVPQGERAITGEFQSI